MDALLRDLRFGVRMLFRRPVLSLAALVGFAASFIPARRVARVDPLEALGTE
jgi:ABC-type antimicrobial peptide transport system permease subunit